MDDNIPRFARRVKEDNVYKALSIPLGTVEKYLHKHLTTIIITREMQVQEKARARVA